MELTESFAREKVLYYGNLLKDKEFLEEITPKDIAYYEGMLTAWVQVHSMFPTPKEFQLSEGEKKEITDMIDDICKE